MVLSKKRAKIKFIKRFSTISFFHVFVATTTDATSVEDKNEKESIKDSQSIRKMNIIPCPNVNLVN